MADVDRNQLIAAIIPGYTGWLRTVAHGILGTQYEALDDLVQEGFIAMWRAVETLDPERSPADYWLKRAARQRMVTVVQHDMRWTGLPDRRNGGHERVVGRNRPISLTEIIDRHDDWFSPIDRAAEYALEGALWAYHDGDLARALDGLSVREREYVFRRFWQDWQGPQLDAHFQTTSNNIWRSAKPKLREALVNLVAVE